MADILIRMDMPNSCVECSSTGLPVAVLILGASCPWCREMIDPKINLRIARHEDCPLVELPEHGDLIDRDALKHKFCTHCDGYEYDTGACVDGDQDCMDAKIIMTAPIIVPSNKEETK